MSMTKTAEDFAKDLKSWNSLQKRGVEVHLISFDDGNGNLESFVVEDWNFYFDEYKDYSSIFLLGGIYAIDMEID